MHNPVCIFNSYTNSAIQITHSRATIVLVTVSIVTGTATEEEVGSLSFPPTQCISKERVVNYEDAIKHNHK